MQKKIYDYAIDAIRVISILAVILIHTTTRQLEISNYDLIHQTLPFFLNQVSRFAVPLFFLISGFALNLNFQEEKYIFYLKKRVSKIFIPYLFWTSIYYFLIYTKHSDSFLTALLTGSASWQLYFIPALFIFYLIFPFLNKHYKILTNKFIFIILFIAEILILNFDYRFHASPFPYPIAVFVFNFFPFYLGIWAVKNRDSILNLIKKVWLILVMCTLFTGFFIANEGITNYYKTWNYIYFYSQWRPSILIYTILVFLTLYFIFQKMKINIVKKLANLSFFVFFVHIIILEIVSKYLAQNSIIFFTVVASISFTIAYLTHKIKFLEKLTG